jgi:hypothetical protein
MVRVNSFFDINLMLSLFEKKCTWKFNRKEKNTAGPVGLPAVPNTLPNWDEKSTIVN